MTRPFPPGSGDLRPPGPARRAWTHGPLPPAHARGQGEDAAAQEAPRLRGGALGGPRGPERPGQAPRSVPALLARGRRGGAAVGTGAPPVSPGPSVPSQDTHSPATGPGRVVPLSVPGPGVLGGSSVAWQVGRVTSGPPRAPAAELAQPLPCRAWWLLRRAKSQEGEEERLRTRDTKALGGRGHHGVGGADLPPGGHGPLQAPLFHGLDEASSGGPVSGQEGQPSRPAPGPTVRLVLLGVAWSPPPPWLHGNKSGSPCPPALASEGHGVAVCALAPRAQCEGA